MSNQDFFDSLLKNDDFPPEEPDFSPENDGFQPEEQDLSPVTDEFRPDMEGIFPEESAELPEPLAADDAAAMPSLDDTILAGGSFLDRREETADASNPLPKDPYDGAELSQVPVQQDGEDAGGYEDTPAADAPASTPKRTRTPWHRRKKRRTPFLVRAALYAALVILLGIGSGLFVWECAQDVFAFGHKDTVVTVVVTKDDNVDSIANKLYSKGLIRHKWLFKLYCGISDAEEKVDPGVYQLNYLYDYHALVNGMIADSASRATATIMIPEGYDCEQIFALLEKNQICAADDLRQAAENYAFDYWFLQDVPIGTESRLEGFLYPDTYDFYISDDAENVLKKILNNFERKIDEDLQAQIQASGYTVREVMTLASMIEEEAANDDERAEISAVLHNRLASEDLQYLQMDSTVFYACRELGGFDLHFDSPYNTYVYPGLPAGPIDNPGMPSILAALTPAEADYTYFATGVDGLNHFFNNHDDFQAFVDSDQYVGNAE